MIGAVAFAATNTALTCSISYVEFVGMAMIHLSAPICMIPSCLYHWLEGTIQMGGGTANGQTQALVDTSFLESL